ncbi:hypothetical protein BCR36DRAFT_406903 [Piromyces finnis]|uniref:L domain-like protein n=1 Tax=Piromyces finnis TaxID=1754191 RepID=A0A1Y1UYN5_9FUNG|nr:hypothetical protein BCR36DRAFT_406903 [Piromyces finnis]|eukprot:ORX42963.1 hypothetical protein BCR36DRAFT_406903 [Piromyces finnis]
MLYSNQRAKVDSNFGRPYKNVQQYSNHSLPNTISLIQQKYQVKNDKNDISKKSKKKVITNDENSPDYVFKDDQKLWTSSTCLYIESIGNGDKLNKVQNTSQSNPKLNNKYINSTDSNISYINSKLIDGTINLKINNFSQDMNLYNDDSITKYDTISERNKMNKPYSKEPSERYSYLKIEDTGQERINLSRKNLYSCVHISGEERVRLLNYQNNFISRIECLSNFRNLIFLDFFNNNIEKIQGLDNLNSLRVLMLGRNKISKIEGLHFVSKLDVLDLHNNEITEIENLSTLSELRVLNLENNKITELANLHGLISLSDLNLKNNHISIVRNIPKLNNLKKVCLAGNKIKSFSDINDLNILHLFDISLEHNPIFNIPLYRSTLIFKFRYIKILDGHRVTEEEKRLSYKITKKEEEKRKENERITQKNEEKKKSINNIQELWKQKMRIIQSNLNDNGVVDLKCLKSINNNSLCQTNTQLENNNSSTSIKPNSSISSIDSNSNSTTTIRNRNKLGSASSNSRSLLNLYNGSNSESTLHYSSSSSLLNSKDSLSTNSRPLSSKTSYLRNFTNKVRNSISSSSQKLLSVNEIKNDSLTSYIEQNKNEIRLYGDTNVNLDKLDATGIKTICFYYIHINNIIEIMDKLKRFTELKKLIFSNNDFSSLNQLHSFSILRNIEEIDILSYDNPIVNYDNLVYYILYRLKHLPLKVVCKKEITETDYENAELMFAGLQKVILKIPTNIIYHTSDLTLPINFTGTVCPMIKQYKSKYMNLETLTTLRKNKINNDKSSNNKDKDNKNNRNVNIISNNNNNNRNSNEKEKNKEILHNKDNNDDNDKSQINNDSNNNNTNTEKSDDIKEKTIITNNDTSPTDIITNSNTNDHYGETKSNTPPSYMRNVIQQYFQLNSLFVMVTQENISIRNKLMESGNFLKYNQFFSLSTNNDSEAMEMNYNNSKKEAKLYVNKLISKCKEEHKKSELFTKMFSNILADNCCKILQKSNNINETMEEALINIINNTPLHEEISK